MAAAAALRGGGGRGPEARRGRRSQSRSRDLELRPPLNSPTPTPTPLGPRPTPCPPATATALAPGPQPLTIGPWPESQLRCNYFRSSSRAATLRTQACSPSLQPHASQVELSLSVCASDLPSPPEGPGPSLRFLATQGIEARAAASEAPPPLWAEAPRRVGGHTGQPGLAGFRAQSGAPAALASAWGLRLRFRATGVTKPTALPPSLAQVGGRCRVQTQDLAAAVARGDGSSTRWRGHPRHLRAPCDPPCSLDSLTHLTHSLTSRRSSRWATSRSSSPSTRGSPTRYAGWTSRSSARSASSDERTAMPLGGALRTTGGPVAG